MADFLRVSLEGTMPTGEKWSVNPVYSIGGDFGAPTTPAQLVTVADAILSVTIPGLVLALNVAAVTHQGVRVEARDLDGTLENLAERALTTPVAGTGVASHPFQTSVVSSLRTAHPGATGRGRLYWPATGLTAVPSTLRISGTNTSATAGAIRDYLGAIETAIEATFTGTSLCVWSRKNAALYPVDRIQVGDVFDVQRRRRDSLVENIATVTYDF